LNSFSSQFLNFCQQRQGKQETGKANFMNNGTDKSTIETTLWTNKLWSQ